MPSPLESLLMGRSNIANSRMALRNRQLADPRTTEAFRQLVEGENATEAAGYAEDPTLQKYADIAKGQNAATIAQVPEIAALHERGLAEQERLATAPARVTGQYNVEAAQAAGRERAALAEQQAERARQLATQRNNAMQQGQLQRQHNAQLERQATSAEHESGFGLLDFLRGRPSTAERAAQLRGQQQFGEPAAHTSTELDQVSDNPEIGEHGMIRGTPVEWDGIGWKVIE